MKYSTRTSESFHPPETIWINCNSFTYFPHLHEYGPRTLLALTIMSCPPFPSKNILLPFMNENIAQLSCWWIATSLISELVGITSFQELFLEVVDRPLQTWTSDSRPFNLATLSTTCPTSLTGSYSRIFELYSTAAPSNNINHEEKISALHNVPAYHNPTSQEPILSNISIPNNHEFSSFERPRTTKDKTQQRITQWTCYRPFITQAPFNESIKESSFKKPNQTYKNHLLSFGTPFPIIDHTKILRVCTQKTQRSFNLYGGGLEIQSIIDNLHEIGAFMFAPISPNVNWRNQNNWVWTKHLFRPCFQQVYLSAVSSYAGLEQQKSNWRFCHFNVQIKGVIIFSRYKRSWYIFHYNDTRETQQKLSAESFCLFQPILLLTKE
jgi:hypothetical protein